MNYSPSALTINIAHFATSLGFIFSQPWSSVLDPALANGPYFAWMPTISQHYNGFGLLFLVSFAVIIFELRTLRAFSPAKFWIVFMQFTACIAVSYWVQLSLIQEYFSGVVFRTPGSSLGYLNPVSIYLSSILAFHLTAILIIAIWAVGLKISRIAARFN